MTSRTLAAFVATSLFIVPMISVPAHADNQMGYRLLSQQDAASLPHNQGALGLNVERSQAIADGGMTFDIIRVTHVGQGSAGARAGFKAGDEIIALDGHVFPSLVAFADYVGSLQPGSMMTVDYMPAGGGPSKAQRTTVIVGRAGQISPPARPNDAAPAPTGMSTGEKVAIGAGAVALFGCYEMGCFSRRSKSGDPRQSGGQPNQQSQSGAQWNGGQSR